MRRFLVPQLAAGLRVMLVMTIALGVAYPLAMTAVAAVIDRDGANGDLVRVDGRVVGSRLIGQTFDDPAYLHPRPSAVDYDASTSSGSNLGPTNPDLAATVGERVAAYREDNGLADDAAVPVDAVTASGSGLDPHISPANARLQARRIAATRDIDVDVVLDVIADHTTARPLGFLGNDAVNVLLVNVALDEVTGGS
jgi:K+-transporting ATPase ATPase C chain